MPNQGRHLRAQLSIRISLRRLSESWGVSRCEWGWDGRAPLCQRPDAPSYLKVCPGWRGQGDELRGALGLHLQWSESMAVTPRNWRGILWGMRECEGQILHPDSWCKWGQWRCVAILGTQSWEGNQPELFPNPTSLQAASCLLGPIGTLRPHKTPPCFKNKARQQLKKHHEAAWLGSCQSQEQVRHYVVGSPQSSWEPHQPLRSVQSLWVMLD